MSSSGSHFLQGFNRVLNNTAMEGSLVCSRDGRGDNLDLKTLALYEIGLRVLKGFQGKEDLVDKLRDSIVSYERMGLIREIHAPYLKAKTLFTIFKLQRLVEEDPSQGVAEVCSTFRSLVAQIKGTGNWIVERCYLEMLPYIRTFFNILNVEDILCLDEPLKAILRSNDSYVESIAKKSSSLKLDLRSFLSHPSKRAALLRKMPTLSEEGRLKVFSQAASFILFLGGDYDALIRPYLITDFLSEQSRCKLALEFTQYGIFSLELCRYLRLTPISIASFTGKIEIDQEMWKRFFPAFNSLDTEAKAQLLQELIRHSPPKFFQSLFLLSQLSSSEQVALIASGLEEYFKEGNSVNLQRADAVLSLLEHHLNGMPEGELHFELEKLVTKYFPEYKGHKIYAKDADKIKELRAIALQSLVDVKVDPERKKELLFFICQNRSPSPQEFLECVCQVALEFPQDFFVCIETARNFRVLPTYEQVKRSYQVFIETYKRQKVDTVDKEILESLENGFYNLAWSCGQVRVEDLPGSFLIYLAQHNCAALFAHRSLVEKLSEQELSQLAQVVASVNFPFFRLQFGLFEKIPQKELWKACKASLRSVRSPEKKEFIKEKIQSWGLAKEESLVYARELIEEGLSLIEVITMMVGLGFEQVLQLIQQYIEVNKEVDASDFFPNIEGAINTLEGKFKIEGHRVVVRAFPEVGMPLLMEAAFEDKESLLALYREEYELSENKPIYCSKLNRNLIGHIDSKLLTDQDVFELLLPIWKKEFPEIDTLDQLGREFFELDPEDQAPWNISALYFLKNLHPLLNSLNRPVVLYFVKEILSEVDKVLEEDDDEIRRSIQLLTFLSRTLDKESLDLLERAFNEVPSSIKNRRSYAPGLTLMFFSLIAFLGHPQSNEEVISQTMTLIKGCYKVIERDKHKKQSLITLFYGTDFFVNCIQANQASDLLRLVNKLFVQGISSGKQFYRQCSGIRAVIKADPLAIISLHVLEEDIGKWAYRYLQRAIPQIGLNSREEATLTFQETHHIVSLIHYLKAPWIETKSKEGTSAQVYFMEFLHSVVNGTHQLRRYDPSLSPHLAKIAAYKGDVIPKWSSPVNSGEIVKYGFDRGGYRRWVSKYYPDAATLPVIGEIISQKKAINLAEFQELQHKFKNCEDPKEAASLNMALNLYGLIYISEQAYFHENSITQEITWINLLLKKSIPTVFKDRLQMRQLYLTKTQELFSQEIEVIDTDDPWEMLQIGIWPSRTCMDVENESEHPLGLLGYLLNGKNRLIVIKEKIGKISERCMVKLLWDEDNQRPVLVQERIYSTQREPVYPNYFQMALKAKAKKLGVALISSISLSRRTYPSNQVVSLEDRAPWEYSDNMPADEGLLQLPYTLPQLYYT